jgi:hypothetical protein
VKAKNVDITGEENRKVSIEAGRGGKSRDREKMKNRCQNTIRRIKFSCSRAQ